MGAEALELCDCENLDKGHYGRVANDEQLIRIVKSPRHLTKKGEVKPNLFPLSDIRTNGVSLLRAGKISDDEILRQTNAITALGNGEEFHGWRIADCETIRLVTDEAENRSLRVLDDPVVNDPHIIDNHAHAIALQARSSDESEILRLQGELMEIFTPYP